MDNIERPTMIDISSFNKSVKVTWIKKYMDTEKHGNL